MLTCGRFCIALHNDKTRASVFSHLSCLLAGFPIDSNLVLVTKSFAFFICREGSRAKVPDLTSSHIQAEARQP